MSASRLFILSKSASRPMFIMAFMAFFLANEENSVDGKRVSSISKRIFLIMIRIKVKENKKRNQLPLVGARAFTRM